MAAPYNFRKALNGFHREDVVRHIEYLNTKFANQTNQLKAELEARDREIAQLRQLEGVQEQLNQLRAYCDSLEQEKREYEDRVALLQTELEQEKANRVSAVSRTEEELEAYRRAERLERQAQQRAEQLRDKTNAIVSDAGQQADASAQRIDALAQQVAAQLSQLQQEVLGSKDILQNVAVAMENLHAEEI